MKAKKLRILAHNNQSNGNRQVVHTLKPSPVGAILWVQLSRIAWPSATQRVVMPDSIRPSSRFSAHFEEGTLRIFGSGPLAAGVMLSNAFVTAQARSPLARGLGNAWGTSVYFVGTNGALQSVSPAGVVTQHGTGFAPFEDMEFGPDGALYLSDLHSDAVLRVSPPDCRQGLNIALLPGAVELTWTTNATGYLLETNSAVTLAAGWGVLASNYNVLDTNYIVTNAANGATRFYRLHRP